ncbi:hypothetical protein SSP531S_39930 [Streptomyces spongiicola]|uniref:Uncharacterized protein n=1 Tax=Streptomyces spongiicola TaxID=1690221 RepID=A0A388T2N9_9ACTN|nr:hypothetical protein SSP531S_39930 [Streptomyces spongiicola]
MFRTHQVPEDPDVRGPEVPDVRGPGHCPRTRTCEDPMFRTHQVPEDPDVRGPEHPDTRGPVNRPGPNGPAGPGRWDPAAPRDRNRPSFVSFTAFPSAVPASRNRR